jgi:hypothetical protein
MRYFVENLKEVLLAKARIKERERSSKEFSFTF